MEAPENEPADEPARPTQRAASPDPARFVRLALAFYGGALALAWLWRGAVYGEPLLYASAEAAQGGVRWGRDVALGLACAALVIGVSRELTRRTRTGDALARALARAVGPLAPRHCVVLALASGIGEEAFFRGALQPRVGLALASLVFGLAHFLPRRELWAWSLFSLAAGLLLGALFESTGNLIAPIVAHATVNAVNLHLLVRDYGSA